MVLEEVKGDVDLEHVYFSYEPGQKLIEDFNLHVNPGERVAIVGPTGCGKTTLINLLMRFYDVNSGTIRVSGVPVKDMTRSSLRSSYGMVLQETWLRREPFVRTSVWENRMLPMKKSWRQQSFPMPIILSNVCPRAMIR